MNGIESSALQRPPDLSIWPSAAQFAGYLYRAKFLLIHYWWIIVMTIAVGVVVQAYRGSQQIPQYMSSSRMMVSGQINVNQGTLYSEDLANFFGTQVAFMKSWATLETAMARVKALHPEVAVDPSAQVDASQEPKTSIFDLQVISSNPEYAPLLLNAVMDTYLANKHNLKEQATDGAVTAITSEIAHLDKQIPIDEQQLLDFEKDNNVVFIEQQSDSAAKYLVGLNDELASLRKEQDLLSLEISKGTDSNDTAGSSDASPSAVPGDPDKPVPNASDANIQQQQESIEKLKILRDEYGAYLKDMHPKMMALSDQIDREQKFLDVLTAINQKKRTGDRENMQLQIQNLESQIADWNKKSIDLSQRLGTHQLLKSKIAREQALYDRLAASVQNVNLNQLVDHEDVSIMEAASSPSLLPGNYRMLLTYGFFYGILAGAGLLFFINSLDDRISSPVDVEGLFEWPVVGQIPLAVRDKKTLSAPLITENDTRYSLVESYCNIRSCLFFQSANELKPKSLLISSSIPGDGKSSLASNLAVTLALAGTRVLLIDADMRKGVLHNLFNTPVKPGLTDYLQGKVHWRDTVCGTDLPYLHIIPRGNVPDHAGKLLLGTAVDHLLEEGTAEYDMVLVDSVPVLAADDVSNLCSRVGGVLFVVRMNHSSTRLVGAALNILKERSANIFGLVLNAVETSQPGSYERYRYKEYYGVKSDA